MPRKINTTPGFPLGLNTGVLDSPTTIATVAPSTLAAVLPGAMPPVTLALTFSSGSVPANGYLLGFAAEGSACPSLADMQVGIP